MLVGIALIPTSIVAQNGCPNCVVSVPTTLPADTIYLSDAAEGQAGTFYEADVSFRMPKTTTPVAANDPSVVSGLGISKITINSVSNLPPGLSWELNQSVFNPSDQTDGCVRFCGMPLQPGYYEVEVVVTAQIFVISQTTSFSFPIIIHPAVRVTEGFTMENSTGCGAVMVDFTNNVPSNGREGFSYRWDFGNGRTSLDENPFPQIYTNPGVYEVQYRAIIDTFGYVLTRVNVDKVSCSDWFGNRPDIYVEIFNPSGTRIFLSSIINDARTPIAFDMNVPIGPGNYTLRVMDRDDGIFSSGDEICGTVNINRLSNGQLRDSQMEITITMIHPVDTISSAELVYVWEQPKAPILTGYDGTKLCKGDTVKLIADYNTDIQWYLDSLPIIGATSSILAAHRSGAYYAIHTSASGCPAASAPLKLEFAELPAGPVFQNARNLLTLFDPDKLPQNYTLQWYLNGEPINNATTHCVASSGIYLLELTDNETGCMSSFSRLVTYDPTNAGCLATSLSDPLSELAEGLQLFPNPTTGQFWLECTLLRNNDLSINLRNVWGTTIVQQWHRNLSATNRFEFDLSTQPAGIYFLEIQIAGRSAAYRIVKQ